MEEENCEGVDDEVVVGVASRCWMGTDVDEDGTAERGGEGKEDGEGERGRGRWRAVTEAV